MAVTVGQLTSLIEALPKLAKDLQTGHLDLSNLPADAVVAEDVIGMLAVFWPPATLLEIALALSVCIGEYIAAHGTPSGWGPDANPEVDANAYAGHRE